MRVAIRGNTYPVREEIKALGGRWDAGQRAWMVPQNMEVRARQVVAGKTISRNRAGEKISHAKCTGCGVTEIIDASGYAVYQIYGGECRGCREERAMGF